MLKLRLNGTVNSVIADMQTRRLLFSCTHVIFSHPIFVLPNQFPFVNCHLESSL